MVDFLTSQFMVAVYVYLFGCILAKWILNLLGINDPRDKRSWVFSWVLVIVLIMRGN